MGNLSAPAFLVALSGIVIVFIMLAALCLIIPVISKLVQSAQKKAVVIERAAPLPNPVSTPTPTAAVVSGDPTLIGVDEKTAACIMAITSHETGIPLSELIFKTIKAI